MVGTPATTTGLYTQFPVGGPAGGITATNAQNLIATLDARCAVSIDQRGASPAASAATNTTAFANAISDVNANGGGIVLIPNGSYAANCGTLTLPSNVSVIGEGWGSIINVGSGTTGNLFVSTSKTNIMLADFQVTSANDDTIVLNVTTCSRVTVRHVRTVGAVLIQTNSTAGSAQSGTTYALVNDANSCSNIQVLDNEGTAATVGVNRRAFIELQWALDAQVRGNWMTGYFNGIWWWGGDSDFAQNGAIANARKARNLTIADNTVYNCGNSTIGGASIAGSMGQNIEIVANRVHFAGDVAVDCEGCFECNVIGNEIWDGVNGALTIFFGNRNFNARDNIIGNSGTNNVLFRVYNNSIDNTQSVGLTLTGNTFISQSGLGLVDDAAGPCGNTIISHNKFVNSSIIFNNSSAGVQITHNTFQYISTLAAHSTITLLMISAGETVNVVSGNEVSCPAAQNAATIFINLTSPDFNLPITYIVENNKNCLVNPIATDIAILESGTNAGVSGQYLVRGNLLTGATHLTRTESGAKASVIRWIDNYDATLSHWPAAVPTTLRWDRGTRIYFPAPSASAFVGSVCTAAGTPGTWKSFGATSA